jgi:two-component system, cell cycle sensor histidine kinase PleC
VIEMHPLLKRQLKRLGVDDEPPTTEQWHELLERIDATYAQADQDRYTLERSLDISSREMQQLYADLKQASETELALERDKLRVAVAVAERASNVKSGFLSNMSHEMRTPLNSILGFARVLDSERFGALTERQREYLEYILRAGTHMLALVNDLLDLRRLEEDRKALAATRVALPPVVEEAIQMVRGLADDKHHELVCALDTELPDALADRRAVVQILVNLLSNAIKFTPERGRIAVIARATPAALLVAVEDTGIGIPAEDHARLFTYFEQLGAKHELGLKGSGIGLALTRALVEKLGGRIAVHSAPGVGSTFEFSIPRWTETGEAA